MMKENHKSRLKHGMSHRSSSLILAADQAEDDVSAESEALLAPRKKTKTSHKEKGKAKEKQVQQTKIRVR